MHKLVVGIVGKGQDCAFVGFEFLALRLYSIPESKVGSEDWRWELVLGIEEEAWRGNPNTYSRPISSHLFERAC